MKIGLNEVTCNDEKSYLRLVHFFMTVYDWKNFDEEQLCSIYVDNKGDLIGFESLSHRIHFINNAHKLYEMFNSPVTVDPVSFKDMKSAFLALGNRQ